MALDQATLDKMSQSLANYKAGGSSDTAPTTQPSAAPTPTANPTNDAIEQSLAKYKTNGGATGNASSIPKDGGNPLADFAKNTFGFATTIAARPFQAAADFGDYLGTQIEANKAPSTTIKSAILADDAAREKKKQTESSFGGFVAPQPATAKDVMKDVGRATQLVALGVPGLGTAGALFGAGASLEQGNDLLSLQTAAEAALGAGGGKILDWIGKPLLSATGRVIGKITPEDLKPIIAKGAGAVAKFAEDHKLISGEPTAFTKAITTPIKKGVDDATSYVKGQFPGLSPKEHYTAMNERDIAQPTTVNSPAYSKSTAIFNDAKDKGINLDKVATEQGVFHHNISEGGKYNTADTVEQLRNTVYDAGGEKARPAIKIASYETPRVSNEQIHGALRKRIHDLPATTADAEEKATMLKNIDRRYGQGSAAAKAHPDGYNLEDLHDNRIRAGKNGHYVPGVSDLPTVAKAKLSRLEESVFKTTFDRTAPPELKIADFRRESQKILTLADYLEKLHGKKVPEGVTKKAVRIFGRGLGGALGGKIGGFPGFLVGSRGGDMLFQTFEEFPNPIKKKILNSLQHDDPAAFKAIVDYIGQKEAERLLQKALPAPGASSFKETPSTFFTTPKGVTTTNKGEAFDVGAVETGKAKRGKSTQKLSDFMRKVDAAQADEIYSKDLPTIKTGPKKKSKKSLSDIF